MIALAKGIAYVSFPGGGMFVPARSPYDRQMLVECVADRTLGTYKVQVLMHSATADVIIGEDNTNLQ